MPDSSDKPKKDKEVLDLLDDSANKLSRRERQRVEAAKVKTVGDHKKEALDIFEEEDGEKKTSVVRKKGGVKKDLPTISKLLDNKDDEIGLSKPAASSESASDDNSSEGDQAGAVMEGNIITIKPPIIVSALADLMNLKPFQLMADLIKLEVTAHRVTHNALPVKIHFIVYKIDRFTHLFQFFRRVRLHVVMLRVPFRRRVHVKSSAYAEIPRGGFFLVNFFVTSR